MRGKADSVADSELRLTEIMHQFDAALEADDASGLSEACLIDPRPDFVYDVDFGRAGETPTLSPTSPVSVYSFEVFFLFFGKKSFGVFHYQYDSAVMYGGFQAGP